MFEHEAAAELVSLLANRKLQIVLAESCTAGLISSCLSQVPGASAVLAGSLVVYQIPAKQRWLNISQEHFRQHDVVSGATSLAMAEAALQKTPWADLAASITGHLGPGAPGSLDGTAWTSVVVKADQQTTIRQTEQLFLDAPSTDGPLDAEVDLSQRIRRQPVAAARVIQLILQVLKDCDQTTV